MGKIPKGGGVEKTDENSQFQFGNFENPGGGGPDFSKFHKIWPLFRLKNGFGSKYHMSTPEHPNDQYTSN